MNSLARTRGKSGQRADGNSSVLRRGEIKSATIGTPIQKRGPRSKKEPSGKSNARSLSLSSRVSSDPARPLTTVEVASEYHPADAWLTCISLPPGIASSSDVGLSSSIPESAASSLLAVSVNAASALSVSAANIPSPPANRTAEELPRTEKLEAASELEAWVRREIGRTRRCRRHRPARRS